MEQTFDYGCEYIAKLTRIKMVNDAGLEAKNAILRAGITTPINIKEVEKRIKNHKTKKEEKTIKKMNKITGTTNRESLILIIQFLLESQINKINIIGVKSKSNAKISISLS